MEDSLIIGNREARKVANKGAGTTAISVNALRRNARPPRRFVLSRDEKQLAARKAHTIGKPSERSGSRLGDLIARFSFLSSVAGAPAKAMICAASIRAMRS